MQQKETESLNHAECIERYPPRESNIKGWLRNLSITKTSFQYAIEAELSITYTDGESQHNLYIRGSVKS